MVTQGKTGVLVAGELAGVLARIQGRAYRFEDARNRAAVALDDAGRSKLAAAYKPSKTTEIYVRSRVGEKVTPTE